MLDSTPVPPAGSQPPDAESKMMQELEARAQKQFGKYPSHDVALKNWTDEWNKHLAPGHKMTMVQMEVFMQNMEKMISAQIKQEETRAKRDAERMKEAIEGD